MNKGKSILKLLMLGIFLFSLAGCSASSEDKSSIVQENEKSKMNIKVGDYDFSVTLEDNSSTKALKEYLKDNSVTLSLDDYNNMEKVGELGITLPTNDEEISTSEGDIILYQGNKICIYYGNNKWNFTKLGKIDNVDNLKSSLGSGSVKVTLSLK